MATYLYRLGRFSFRRRRLVAALWLAVLAAAGIAAAGLKAPTSASFSIPGTEAQQAFDLLGQRFPELSAEGASARVVFAAPEDARVTDPAPRAAIQQSVAALATAGQVAMVVDPFEGRSVSPEGRVAYARVQYTVPAADLTDGARDALLAAGAPARAAGLTVEFGGDAVEESGGQQLAEVIGVAVAAVVLVITLGSLVAAGLPLLTALIGVGVGMAGITATSGLIELNDITPVLALMLGLAVSIDYALLIVSRHRHELAAGRSPQQAAAHATATAGSAVVFAGMTVVIALAGLSVVGLPLLTKMGLAAAATVTVAVLVAVTLLPALLGFAGHRVAPRRPRGRMPDADAGPATGGQRWARFVTRHRGPILVAAVLGLGLVAVPGAGIRLALPDDSVAGPDTTQRKAYDLLTDGFGPGFNGPLTIVIDARDNADASTAFALVAAQIRQQPGFAQVTPPVPNRAGDTAILTAVPETAPNSAQTEALLRDIRDQRDQIEASTNTRLFVTGTTALNIDASTKFADALPIYLSIVIGLALILLTLVFRSILVPLSAALGFLLTIAATFGAVVAVFQWGWLDSLFGVEQTAPIVSVLPIVMIGVLFGLAMDYQVFLVTRMREAHTHGLNPQQAVVDGFGHAARVVTAAAVIMVSVFAGFVLSDDIIVKSLGFALAFGVLVDAFIVRMTIVPALMSILGGAAWRLPRWLDRLVPNVDIEGRNVDVQRASASEPLTPSRT